MDNNTSIYNVLNLEPFCPLEQIKEKYFNIIKLYHPDKLDKDDPERMQKIKFIEKLNKLYNNINTPEKKEKYDEKLNENINKSKFLDLKKEFGEFIDLQSKNTKDVKTNENEFKKLMNEKNEEIGFNGESVKIPIQQNEFKKRLMDIQMARDQETIDLAPKKIFNSDSDFDKERFNEIFENIHNKKSKQIIPIEQIDTIGDYDFKEEIGHVPIDQDQMNFENIIDTSKFSKFTNDDEIPEINLKIKNTNKKTIIDDKPDELEITKRMNEYRQQTQELLTISDFKKEIDKGFVNDIISKIVDNNEKDISCLDTKDSESSKKNDMEIKIDNESEKKIITEKLIKIEIKKKKLLEKLKKIEKSVESLNKKNNKTKKNKKNKKELSDTSDDS